MRNLIEQQLGFMKEIGYETIEKAPKGVGEIVECFNFWIDTIQPMLTDYAKGMTLSDIRWGAVLYKELNWAGHSAIFRAYLDCLRTLRGIFEMLVQTHILEKNCQIPREQDRFSFILSRLWELDESYQTFRVGMVDRMPGFDHEEQVRLRNLYHELSLYSHPSGRQLDLESAPVPLLDFKKADFELCTRLMLDVTDLMVAVAIELCPEISGVLREWLDRTKSWEQMQSWGMLMSLRRRSESRTERRTS